MLRVLLEKNLSLPRAHHRFTGWKAILVNVADIYWFILSGGGWGFFVFQEPDSLYIKCLSVNSYLSQAVH